MATSEDKPEAPDGALRDEGAGLPRSLNRPEKLNAATDRLVEDVNDALLRPPPSWRSASPSSRADEDQRRETGAGRPGTSAETPGPTVTGGGDEAGLVARLRASDARAFEELVIAYQHRVFAVAARMLGNRAEAEEIAQEVFLRVHRAIRGFRGDAKLSTWLYSITSRLCLNRLATTERRLTREDDETLARVSGGGPGAAEELERRQLQAALHRPSPPSPRTGGSWSSCATWRASPTRRCPGPRPRAGHRALATAPGAPGPEGAHGEVLPVSRSEDAMTSGRAGAVLGRPRRRPRRRRAGAPGRPPGRLCRLPARAGAIRADGQPPARRRAHPRAGRFRRPGARGRPAGALVAAARAPAGHAVAGEAPPGGGSGGAGGHHGRVSLPGDRPSRTASGTSRRPAGHAGPGARGATGVAIDGTGNPPRATEPQERFRACDSTSGGPPDSGPPRPPLPQGHTGDHTRAVVRGAGLADRPLPLDAALRTGLQEGRNRHQIRRRLGSLTWAGHPFHLSLAPARRPRSESGPVRALPPIAVEGRLGGLAPASGRAQVAELVARLGGAILANGQRGTAPSSR